MAGNKIPTHIRKMCELLKDDRSEFQCAAAMVLGELKVKNAFVVKSLGEVLNNGEDNTLRAHVLDAFEKIESKESLKYIVPFLFRTEPGNTEFTERAIAIASVLGVESAKELKAMLKEAGPREKCIIFSVFAKMQSLEGLKVLLDALVDEDESITAEICRLMKEEVGDLPTDKKKSFSTKVEQFLKDKKKIRSRQTISAAIEMLGHIGYHGSQSTLMAFTTMQNHPLIRSQALRSLKDIMVYAEAKPDWIKKLISYLDENDYNQIVSPTMDILTCIPIPTRLADLIIQQLKNPQDSVKRFAIRKLRELNSPKVVRVLVEYLTVPDTTMRNLAAESLCWLDAARTVLLDKIFEEDDLELCLLYSKILKPHATKFRKNQIKKLSDHLLTLMGKNSPLKDAFIFLLKTAAPDYLHDTLFNRALQLKRKKDFEGAIETLKMLQREGHVSNDARYELSLCQVKLIPDNVRKSMNYGDIQLSHLQFLVKETEFSLFDKLTKDKHLTKEDLLCIGSFLMNKLQKEREFAAQLLNHLVKKSPRSKAGLAAKKLMQNSEMAAE